VSQTGTVRSQRSKLRVIHFAPFLAIIALICWAFASPVGSSPDDDFHLASIWCAAGDKPTECSPAADESMRAVPEAIGKKPCFAHKSRQSAACQDTSPDGRSDLTTTSRGNFQGLYPSLYYLTMNPFVGASIEVSVLLMRIFSILLFVGLTTVLYVLLPVRRRSTLIWGLAISIVPLGLFLVASNNPSGWAIISGGTLWISLVGYFESSGARKVGLGVTSALSAVIGAGSRADSAAYVALAVVVAFLLTARLDRRWIISALLPVALVLAAAVFYFSTQQTSVAVSGLPGYAASSQPLSWRYLFITDLLNVPSLWAGVFGTWPLGWMDTLMPAMVWVGGLGCFAALAFTGLVSLSTRKVLAVSVIVGALLFMPAYVLAQSGAIVGEGVQPRYIQPLVIMLAGIVLLQVDRLSFSISAGQGVAIVSILTIVNAIALHVNMRRYVTGTDITNWNLNAAVEWWWGIPVTPMVVWSLGSLSFAAFLVSIAWGTMFTRPGRMLTPDTAPVSFP
jgi:hypothetical protein